MLIKGLASSGSDFEDGPARKRARTRASKHAEDEIDDEHGSSGSKDGHQDDSLLETLPIHVKLKLGRSSPDFAVSPAKAKEVKAWLLDKKKSPSRTTATLQKNLLVLHGPPGSGKSSLLHSLANELEIELVEWTYPAVLRSAAYNLRDFAFQASYPSVFEPRRKRFIVLDDLPSPFAEDMIREVIRIVTSSDLPLIAVFSGEDRRVDAELAPHAVIISLREVATKKMKNALKLAASRINLDLSKEMLDGFVAEASGDMRAALNALQAVSGSSDRILPCRDSHLAFSHAAGKVFHAKRLENGVLKDPPESISERLGSECRLIQPYLFENLHSFFTDTNDVARALEGLSCADLLSRWFSDRLGLSDMAELAFCVSAGSIIVHNKHRAKSSFLALSSGRSWVDFHGRGYGQLQPHHLEELRRRPRVLDRFTTLDVLEEIDQQALKDPAEVESIEEFEDSD
uniref:AAA+ ATPase domain-containing protein n=1 Tax=Rhodosorus marinus TaxID=101924 RepID=A0A7S3EPI4_9RHOD|mmetsp:Transcript_7814/g.34798  ORF Transcript_7814/g.34798 Transcript_7814/m.34798 type:complete len:457 (+) Transcript_7814:2541-3911(+)|eukprot:CAMPEP_0113967168 /NCGR_PEP_ID=MMETSP0011_2-20120614/8766_1 /TAXON_ID=101924 /ORGANISM="Rhodosorus marinus" /LENGTH=456 /DNA_ID=CAMNT_0000979993 /DNA_START=376 /DNA_END=1746 /DNA_ORIENTATION=- /assembly_acc=CAM_ASM_000156